ncbi:MAG: ABC transporter substrate-binding protein [Betaproteobacteria bacterium]|nr:ABC transporter substrate-binding protein [Betaproteobacteria bacterium]
MVFRALLVLLIVMFASTASVAKNFRWSSQGDAATLDPHSQNETFNNGINNLVYETLANRGRENFSKHVPGLAVSWTNTGPLTWVFKLRQGVKFHDGTPFTADDVVFSFNRARESTVTFRLYSTQSGIAKKIDDYTVEFTTPVPNPVMLDTVINIQVMSKAWCEKNGAAKPLDYIRKEETFATRNAMGTGPYKLVAWEQGVKILHKKNPDWWGIKAGQYTGNIETIDYRPISNGATRMAALKSGEIDFVLDPSVQDVLRLRDDADVKIWEGQEQRLIYLGTDQARDELLYSDVKGKNPFKDKRVRLALYQAIDIEALKTSVMRGLSIPTGIPLPAGPGAGVPVEMEKRHPYDPAKAKKLLAEAGYPNGFGFTLHCPNDRYVNDEKICVAIAGMWARVGLTVRVEPMTKANFFPKVQKRDTSAFLAGWGGGSTDAIFALKPIMHSRDGKGAGDSNYGDAKIPELDALIDKLEGEMNLVERQAMINRAVKIMQDEVHVIPLHRQMIPWASRRNVTVLHRPNNLPDLHWITIK